jgi:hypothetical protein
MPANYRLRVTGLRTAGRHPSDAAIEDAGSSTEMMLP